MLTAFLLLLVISCTTEGLLPSSLRTQTQHIAWDERFHLRPLMKARELHGLPVERLRGGEDEEKNKDYYKGAKAIHDLSNQYIQMIERRDLMAIDDDNIVLVMVGLPGRGKSFLSRKIELFMSWSGEKTKVFNVGKYRRLVEKPENSGKSDFFAAENHAAGELREKAAGLAMQDMLDWLDGDGKVGIFDATNSARSRRKWVWNTVKARNVRNQVVFVESICDDQTILRENFLSKVNNSPDFKGMTREEAIADLTRRCENYEQKYQEVQGDRVSYIKLYNLSSRVMVNKIYGHLASGLLPFLMACHIGTRPIWLVRAGSAREGDSHIHYDSEGVLRKGKAAELSVYGEHFAQSLASWIQEKSNAWMEQNGRHCPAHRRTQSALLGPYAGAGDMCTSDQNVDARTGEPLYEHDLEMREDHHEAPACKVFTSTLPRALNTVGPLGLRITPFPQLNPLDRGELSFHSWQEIEESMPRVAAAYKSDPFNFRFPGGESVGDMVTRLQSVLIEIEQQTSPVLVVSHTSAIQALYSYFAGIPIEKCHEIEFPQHSVVQLTPVLGGSWIEERFSLSPPQEGGCQQTKGPTALTDVQAEFPSSIPLPTGGSIPGSRRSTSSSRPRRRMQRALSLPG